MYRLIYRENEQQEHTGELTYKDKQEFYDKLLNIEFGSLRDLYAIYGTNSFPNTLKIKESRPTIDGKRVRKYKLITS